MNAKRGRLVTIEGIEGVGKSTHIKTICEVLRRHGIDVVATREPGGTLLGEELRRLLLSEQCAGLVAEAELLMMFAARAEHIVTVVRPALDAGQWVVSDRFTDASYAYQGGGRGCSRALLDALRQSLCAEVHPDLTFLLDLEPDQAHVRVETRGNNKDRFEAESREFFTRVREAYLVLSKEDPRRWRVIPAQQSIEQIKAAIVRELENLLETPI